MKRRLSIVLTVLLLMTTGLMATPAQASPDPAEPTAEYIPADDPDMPDGTGKFAASMADYSTAQWTCSVHASNPWKQGTSKIGGDGFQQCSGTGYQPIAIKIVIQKRKGLGIWANMHTPVRTPFYYTDWLSIQANTSCAGQGTQTYRVVITGYAVGGAYSAATESASYLRVYCA